MDGGAQVSHCWREKLHTSKKEEEASMIPVVMNYSWRHLYELMFSSALIKVNIVFYVEYTQCEYNSFIYALFLALSIEREQKQLFCCFY